MIWHGSFCYLRKLLNDEGNGDVVCQDRSRGVGTLRGYGDAVCSRGRVRITGCGGGAGRGLTATRGGEDSHRDESDQESRPSVAPTAGQGEEDQAGEGETGAAENPGVGSGCNGLLVCSARGETGLIDEAFQSGICSFKCLKGEDGGAGSRGCDVDRID